MYKLLHKSHEQPSLFLILGELFSWMLHSRATVITSFHLWQGMSCYADNMDTKAFLSECMWGCPTLNHFPGKQNFVFGWACLVLMVVFFFF